MSPSSSSLLPPPSSRTTIVVVLLVAVNKVLLPRLPALPLCTRLYQGFSVDSCYGLSRSKVAISASKKHTATIAQRECPDPEHNWCSACTSCHH
ncbi:hypothetical protein PILCRDRAFT_531245 [Piloderma croceum F 1598]|uniref:Uncharacterized protein n=1 Tax=Piloderma croceum (strain F 1598) TaxID=765440 RepID=A0A0C3B2C9_PILCF|nr:hypothetical protein PILCRDRAFT_531245 [Piloderma croceum F 1598]